MTQEEKSLLLKDLSARLPYDLYVRVEEFNVPKNEAITEGFVGNYLKDNRCNDYDADGILNEFADGCIDIKPYLRSLSSMTEEEENELLQLMGRGTDIERIDFYISHHFDYRGLILTGLAIEAPEDMYNN